MSLWPKKALVLAAGLGTRLRPLTFGCPKPMLPLWNVPLLERVLAQLESWGVEEIAVNLHWRPEAVERHLASRGGKARVRVSFEPEILGTGGALRPVRDFLGDTPFWMVNADIVASLKPDDLVGAFSSGGGLASAWVEPKKGPRTGEADGQGRVTCVRSRPAGVRGSRRAPVAGGCHWPGGPAPGAPGAGAGRWRASSFSSFSLFMSAPRKG